MEEHFMIRETREGSEAIRRTIVENKEVVRTLVRELKGRGVDRGFIIGSGTSFHASLVLGFLLSKYTGLHFVAVPASEFEDWTPLVTSDYAIIAFSQSGESSDIIKAVKAAKTKGVFVIGITNTPGSTLTKISDFSLITRAGEEKAVVATKTYDAQLAIASLLAYNVSDTPLAEVNRGKLEQAHVLVKEVLEIESTIKDIATRYKEAEHAFILGRGVNYPNALEMALKLKEAAMIHAEGFAVREFLHGPVQLVDETTPVIIFLPTKKSLKESEKTIDKLKSYNAKIIAIAGKGVDVSDFASDVITIPDIDEDLSIFPVIKAAQLFAYHLSIARGLNPDKPTKLAKVVKYEEGGSG
ncbi:MAG: hypothetical protein DRJ51_03210 [Thermoprotei archaeon]|nr:MAG: hypothetical protein DRJ51_03210 [Thermoprotei archaeon]RLF03304.1 MAG: hypothetical protein DRJ59_01015 [Thermoprotei archaeon]